MNCGIGREAYAGRDWGELRRTVGAWMIGVGICLVFFAFAPFMRQLESQTLIAGAVIAILGGVVGGFRRRRSLLDIFFR